MPNPVRRKVSGMLRLSTAKQHFFSVREGQGFRRVDAAGAALPGKWLPG